MDARYVFHVRFRIPVSSPGVRLDPDRFETTLYRLADRPSEDGWLFFRDNLWRGAINDEEYLQQLATDALSVPVEAVEYRALETDEEYFDALKAEIASDLDQFNADAVSEVLSKYLGSSIEVDS